MHRIWWAMQGIWLEHTEVPDWKQLNTQQFNKFFFLGILIMDWTKKEDIVQACKDVNTKTFLLCLEKTNR